MSPLLDVAILRATPTPERASAATPSTPGEGLTSLGTELPDGHDAPSATPADAADHVSRIPVPATGSAALATIDIATLNGVPSTTISAASYAPLPSLAPDALAAALDRDDVPADTIKRARCDDIARRIIRDGGHTSMTALAREIGTSPATLKRLMSTHIYRDTYNRVSDELLGTIDDRIADERLDTLARGDTLQRRAMTVLAEALEISRGHMRAVRDNGAIARPQLLKVAVDAAAEVRQIVSARSSVGANGTTINVNVTRNQATIIQGALRESGVDLSDVLGDAFAPAARAVGE